MFQLIYSSKSRQSMGDADLISLLKKSRDKNSKLNITGMLLYKENRFMQLLEGKEEDVLSLFSTIKQDNRHEDVLVLFEKHCDHAVFNNWSMGFVNLDNDYAKNIPGYTDFLSTPLDTKDFVNDPTLALQFLYIFKYAHLDGL